MTRIRRNQRRRGVSVRLSERDVLILNGLGRFRLARTSHLLRLAFAGVRRDTGVKRLRRLFDAGYLEAHVGDRSQDNVFSLGPAGKRWVVLQGGAVGPLPRGGLDHHLTIVHTWAEIAQAAFGSSDIELTLFRPDWEIRERFEASELSVVPDALVELSLTNPEGRPWPLRFVLEIDLGTEGLRTLGHKTERYARLLGRPSGLFGWPDFGLVVYLRAGDARTERVANLLEREWPGWSAIFREAEDTSQALERICTTALEDALSDSPDGMGRTATASDDSAGG